MPSCVDFEDVYEVSWSPHSIVSSVEGGVDLTISPSPMRLAVYTCTLREHQDPVSIESTVYLYCVFFVDLIFVARVYNSQLMDIAIPQLSYIAPLCPVVKVRHLRIWSRSLFEKSRYVSISPRGAWFRVVLRLFAVLQITEDIGKENEEEEGRAKMSKMRKHQPERFAIR